MNLQHSKSATNNITRVIIELETDIVLLQEPYLYDNKPIGFPTKYRILTSGTGKYRAAIAVINSSIDVLNINQLSDEMQW